MSVRRRRYMGLSDVDRVDLIPTPALIDALRRRFDDTFVFFGRSSRFSKRTETFVADDGSELSRILRAWWIVVDARAEAGDIVHINEDQSVWETHTVGEDLEK